MGLKLNVSQVKAQLTKMNSALQKDKSDAIAAKAAVKSFTSNVSLQGKAYQNAKTYFNQTHIPALSQIISICDRMLEQNNRYSKALSRATENKLDEADLTDKIATAKRQRRQYQQLQERERQQNLSAGLKANTLNYTGTIDSLGEIIRRLEKQLDDLYIINKMTANLFTEEKAALDTLKRAINTLSGKGGWNAAAGKFIVPKQLICDLEKSRIAIDNAFYKGIKWDMQYSGDPVNMVSGNYIYEKEYLMQGGKIPLSITLFYNSADHGEACLASSGFTHSHNVYLHPEEGAVHLTLGDGRQEVYLLQDGEYRGQSGPENRTLARTEDGYCYEDEAKQHYQFDLKGRLLSVRNKRGNNLTYTYGEEGLLETVASNAGTGLIFTYNEEKQIIKVQDLTGRKIQMIYKEGLLSQLITEEGGTFTYTYDEQRKLTSINNPRGIDTLCNTFDGNSRVKEQHFPDGGKMTYVYNEQARETILTQQNGNQIRYLHDEKGRSTKVIYADGEEVTEYNAQNQQAAFTDKNGNKTTFSYNKQGRLTEHIDPLGQQTQLDYDAQQNLICVTACGVKLQRSTYDENGNMIKTTDGIGREYQITYNPFGQPVEIIKPDKSILKISYDACGNPSTRTDADGSIIRYAYDRLGRVISSIDGNGNKTSYAYDKRNNLTSVTNPEGNTKSFRYDESGNVTEIIDYDGGRIKQEYNDLNLPQKITDKNGAVTKLEYDNMWRLYRIIDSEKNTTVYLYDKQGRLTHMMNPAGDAASFSYDQNGNKTEIKDPMGNIMRLTYDVLNRVTSQIDENGAETKIEYDFLGNITKRTDPLGNVMTAEYDAAGQMIRRTDILGNQITYTYTKLGSLKTITDHKGRVTKYTYAKGGLLEKITYPDGSWHKYTYDNNKNIKTRETQNGIKMTYDYNALDQIQQMTDQEGNKVHLSYDLLGRIKQTTDANGNTTHYRHDPMGSLLAITDAAGNQVSYTYDTEGQMISVKQSKGTCQEISDRNKEQREMQITKYERDQAGRITKVIDAGGNTETYTYNQCSRIATKTDKDGNRSTFSYDPVGNLTGISYADGKHVSYAYNALHQLTEINDWLGVTEIKRDGFGRENKITDHSGNVVNYTWNEENQLTMKSYPDGSNACYHYDRLSRLERLIAGEEQANYRYDPQGRLREKTMTGGQNTTYQYNSLGRLSELTHTDETGVLDHYRYTYDPAGNKTGIEKTRRDLPEDSGSFTYAYDNLHRLISTTKDGKQQSAYTYDAFGNRTTMTKGEETTTYHYNTLNQLTKQTKTGGLTPTTSSFTCDKRGNLIEEMQLGRAQHTYKFNAQNRLQEATGPAGEQAQYTYNGLGLRTARQDMRNPATNADYILDLTKQYNNLLQKQENGQTQTYYWDAGVTFAKDSTGTYTYLQDELGTPIRLTGRETKEAYAYDEFGQSICGAPGKTQPFAYTGYLPDHTTGTHYAQAREYMPNTGRFTAQDNHNPSILMPETQNPYTYCWNNPQNYTDRDGNFPSKADLISGAQQALDMTIESIDYGLGVEKRLGAAAINAIVKADPKIASRQLAREIGVNPVTIAISQNPDKQDKEAFGRADFENVKDDHGNQIWQTNFNCWQQNFGYNDLYDGAFDLGTNMEVGKYDFHYQGEKHMIWAWRGDYLNLGAGAELGIYSKSSIPGHYDTRPDLAIPMKLGLMDRNGKMIIQRGASDNWWVTGFNPNYLGANPADMTAIYTLDFSRNPGMFKAFYAKWGENSQWKFDLATCTAVFIFGGGSIDG